MKGLLIVYVYKSLNKNQSNGVNKSWRAVIVIRHLNPPCIGTPRLALLRTWLGYSLIGPISLKCKTFVSESHFNESISFYFWHFNCFFILQLHDVWLTGSIVMEHFHEYRCKECLVFFDVVWCHNKKHKRPSGFQSYYTTPFFKCVSKQHSQWQKNGHHYRHHQIQSSWVSVEWMSSYSSLPSSGQQRHC